jgi:hypothetical protein
MAVMSVCDENDCGPCLPVACLSPPANQSWLLALYGRVPQADIGPVLPDYRVSVVSSGTRVQATFSLIAGDRWAHARLGSGLDWCARARASSP